MRSLTSLHENRSCSPQNFLSPPQNDFCNTIGQYRPYLLDTLASSNAFDLGFSNHGLPPLQVAGHDLLEIARAAGRRFTPQRADALRHPWLGHMSPDLRIEARDNLLWQLGRSNHARP